MINFQKAGNLLFSKKTLLQIYFVIFIILNIIDFIGYLQGDFDFFKKLMSWTIIGYIFYKASPTKIFIGTRNKLFDFLLIISFSLMTIIKSLMHYVNIEQARDTQFLIFNYIIEFFQNIENRTSFEQILFTIGLIATIVISSYLLKKHSSRENSLIGSFNIKGYFKFIGGEYLILNLSMIFFSLIVFNFFMEWFALAVDSLILVLGLTYYTLKFLHHHTNLKTTKLATISNTGNQFYLNLIEYFSNKKTFLIGVSFLLTIHLVVDIGVYLVPYTFGNSNALYLQTVNTPIFNVMDFNNSQFSKDYEISNSILTTITIILANISSILFYFLIMLGPFFYFYKFIQKIKTHSPQIIKHLLLTSSFSYLIIYLLPSFKLPITLGLPNITSMIAGVELKTSQLILEQTPTLVLESITFLVLFILIHILTYYLLKNNHSQFFKYKLMPIISVVFFILYISIFFLSVINIQTQSIQKDYFNKPIAQNEGEYQKIIDELNNHKLRKYNLNVGNYSVPSPFDNNITLYDINVIPLIKKINDTHFQGYFLINLYEINPKYKYNIDDIGSVYFENNGDYNNLKFQNSNVNLIYDLGINHQIYQNLTSNNGYNLAIHLFNSKEKSSQTIFELFRFFFTAIFYIFGSIAFVRYFFKEKILD